MLCCAVLCCAVLCFVVSSSVLLCRVVVWCSLFCRALCYDVTFMFVCGVCCVLYFADEVKTLWCGVMFDVVFCHVFSLPYNAGLL